MTSRLLSPITIKNITLKNRITISPMCQYSAADGFANDWHLVHYGSRAVGGAALIIQEATAVSPEGRISPGDLGLYKDEHIERLKSITSFVRQYGAVAGVQLAHAGRKAGCAVPLNGGKQLKKDEGGWTIVAPSAIPFNLEEEAPEALDLAGIQKVIGDFKTAAGRALTAGFQVVEIHAAHGYLIHQFLSPLSNQRTDAYGGSFENRIRLLLEVVNSVKSVWPEDLPLFVRISATDWVEGGWNVDEAVELAAILKELGVDLIDCSSGGLAPTAKIPLGPGYQVAFAERIKNEAGILTGAVGLITEVRQAEDILANQSSDLILIARASLRDPHFALHAARILEDDIAWPLQYIRAKI
jgi:2,4-dienoyl-CoA reductase-like NADH-dependent reductase (Old Yellow Enzyme family)